MDRVRARVRNGRLVLDEPTDLPEGIEIELVVAEAVDALSEGERAAPHQAIGVALPDQIRRQRIETLKALIGKVELSVDIPRSRRRPDSVGRG